MLVAVLVVTLAAGTPAARTFRVPDLTLSQCRALMNTPAAWWTLRSDAEARCEVEFQL